MVGALHGVRGLLEGHWFRWGDGRKSRGRGLWVRYSGGMHLDLGHGGRAGLDSHLVVHFVDPEALAWVDCIPDEQSSVYVPFCP